MKAVILAGGSGERFWPLSTPEKPKQFLNIFGGKSLIRQSVDRLSSLVRPEEVFIITSSELVSATRRELSEVPRSNIIGEPMRRDTAAAVALGVKSAAVKDEDVIAFFSSDQLILDVRAFRRAVKKAATIAARREVIVTLGIKPQFAATGYGYVNPANGTFVEKPSAAKARAYLKKGYLWNAGMFIARAGVFKAAFAEFAPLLLSIKPTAVLYESLPRLSFDYAVMEKLSQGGRVAVVPCDCGWDDVGSYAAFDKYFPHDRRGNVREGPVTVVEAEDNICVARSAKISLLGVKNLVVVTTADAVLVADKSQLSMMKNINSAQAKFAGK